MRVWAGLLLFLVPLVLSASPKSDEKFFDTKVAPILTKRCLPCHDTELNNGGISFRDRRTLIAGGKRGPSVVPGHPETSVMIQSLKHEGELQMPPGPALPAKESELLTEWVRRGAVWGTKLPMRRKGPY